jgi:hypothetical protein
MDLFCLFFEVYWHSDVKLSWFQQWVMHPSSQIRKEKNWKKIEKKQTALPVAIPQPLFRTDIIFGHASPPPPFAFGVHQRTPPWVRQLWLLTDPPGFPASQQYSTIKGMQSMQSTTIHRSAATLQPALLPIARLKGAV